MLGSPRASIICSLVYALSTSSPLILIVEKSYCCVSCAAAVGMPADAMAIMRMMSFDKSFMVGIQS